VDLGYPGYPAAQVIVSNDGKPTLESFRMTATKLRAERARAANSTEKAY